METYSQLHTWAQRLSVKVLSSRGAVGSGFQMKRFLESYLLFIDLLRGFYLMVFPLKRSRNWDWRCYTVVTGEPAVEPPFRRYSPLNSRFSILFSQRISPTLGLTAVKRMSHHEAVRPRSKRVHHPFPLPHSFLTAKSLCGKGMVMESPF